MIVEVPATSAVTDNDLKRLENLIIGIANGQRSIETRLTAIDAVQLARESREELSKI